MTGDSVSRGVHLESRPFSVGVVGSLVDDFVGLDLGKGYSTL